MSGDRVRWEPLFRGLAVGLLSLSLSVNAWAAEEQGLGQALFESGLHNADGHSAELSARAGGDARWVMRGRAVACANCHGVNGEGGGEGFQRAPTLRWPEWASTDATLRAGARDRLRRAVLEGRGADGQPLSQAMPRFDLDEATLAAIADHTEQLVVGRVKSPLPILALLRLGGEQAPTQERLLHQRLVQCLNKRVGDRIQLLVQDVPDAQAAARAWAQWDKRPEVLAVLAPPWRGWHPPYPMGGHPAPLVALFPLVADPQAEQIGALWLLGGAQARSAALVQAWLADAHRPESMPSIPVWPGRGEQANERWNALAGLARRVFADTGQHPHFTRLKTPQGDPDIPGLWLDSEGLPGPGWWLVPLPLAAQPAPGSRWWMAQPFAGTAQRPLAHRWADAVCITVEAGLGQGPSRGRAGWVAQLGALGRLNDGAGWSWQVMAPDPGGLGAVSAWSVVAFDGTGTTRLVNPRVDLGRLPVDERKQTAVSGAR